MFSIGFILVAVGVIIFNTDRRPAIVQLIKGHRKADYVATLAFLVGLMLLLASVAVWSWRALP